MSFELNYSHAFAYHKIIVDEDGRPTDYEYLEMNKAYEKIKDLLPNYVNDKFKWLEVYGKVASTGIPTSFEEYSEMYGRWYRVEVASHIKGYFATIFCDITSQKEKEQELLSENEQLGGLYEEIAATEEELTQQMEELEKSTQLLKESERRLNRAQALAQVGNWEIDLESKMIWASEEAFNLYDLNRETPFLPLDKAQKMVHIEDRAKLDKALERLINEGEEYDVCFRIRKDSGERYIHSVAEVAYDTSGKPIRILGVLQDITASVLYEMELSTKNRELTTLYEELRGTEEELRQQFDEIVTNKALIELSEERYKALANSSQDFIYSCDCEGVISTINRTFSELIGVPHDRIIGKTIGEFQEDSGYIKKWNEVFSRVIETGKGESFAFRYERERGRGKGYYDINLSPMVDQRRKIIGVLCTNHDITTLKKNEQTIKHMAYYDFITDLPNRVLFLKRLKNAIALAKNNESKIGVIFLDLDNFKRINDTLGHETGNQVLIEASKRLLNCVDGKHTVSRLGGDEFSLLIEDVKYQEGLSSLLERIKMSFQDPLMVNHNTINLTASIGVSMYPEDADSAEDLIKNADTAMYKAKEFGKNDYQFFDYGMKEDLLRKTNIERLLRKAIENDEFELHYQPQYTASTGKLRGFEALIRWDCPELGRLNPIEFIPIAEETGLIIKIGEWVLATASRTCKKFETKYLCDLVMAVNISPIQLRQKDFYEMVVKTLKLSGLKHTSLELEVTESIFIDSYECIANELRKLKELGVRIALDDFGTGYSSLSYLRKLPINLLKIDKAFIQEIDNLIWYSGLTESIISLASKLNIKTIAEGVETLDQLNYLLRAKCDFLQGYYFGKPVPEELMGVVLEKGGFYE